LFPQADSAFRGLSAPVKETGEVTNTNKAAEPRKGWGWGKNRASPSMVKEISVSNKKPQRKKRKISIQKRRLFRHELGADSPDPRKDDSVFQKKLQWEKSFTTLQFGKKKRKKQGLKNFEGCRQHGKVFGATGKSVGGGKDPKFQRIRK